MRLNFVKISPAKNTTVLITDYVDPEDYAQVARVVMSYEYLDAEQVGFIVSPRNRNARLRLEMSGGEFCGNGLLSAAAYGLYKGICREGEFLIESSGVDAPLRCAAAAESGNTFRVKGDMPAITGLERLTLEIGTRRISGNLVHLPGISHFVTDFWPTKEDFDLIVDTLQVKADAQALGVIPFQKLDEDRCRILPYVYVRETGSRVFEQACGSGSLALGVHLAGVRGPGCIRVEQPGGSIAVETGVVNRIATAAFLTCEGVVNIDESRL